MILAGDVGGTSARLAVYRREAPGGAPVHRQTYPSRDFSSVENLLNHYLQDAKLDVDVACLGIAGPVVDGCVTTPNLPWRIDAKAVQAKTPIKQLRLVNDLQAYARGIESLSATDFFQINAGVPADAGNAALIAAGTGLGEAGLIWDGARRQILATEGGHADFAPANELQIELLRYLAGRFAHVSYERVLSGPGLVNIHRFLIEQQGMDDGSAAGAIAGAADPAAAIADAALAGTSPACMTALDLFVSIYGAAAGNLALKFMARAGLYIGGGIAPKILPKLRGPRFMNAFADKGRMSGLCQSFPVKVILDTTTALRGAALFACDP